MDNKKTTTEIKPIDPDNPPSNEVVAFCIISLGTNTVQGHIVRMGERFICEGHYRTIYDVTHYMEVPELNDVWENMTT